MPAWELAKSHHPSSTALRCIADPRSRPIPVESCRPAGPSAFRAGWASSSELTGPDYACTSREGFFFPRRPAFTASPKRGCVPIAVLDLHTTYTTPSSHSRAKATHDPADRTRPQRPPIFSPVSTPNTALRILEIGIELISSMGLWHLAPRPQLLEAFIVIPGH